jgi:PAS domain S-box-containing protein
MTAKPSQPLILTIDDEPSIRQSFCNYLEDYGYRVIEAQNGRQGLDLFAAEHPDLVLVDLRMPELDGLAVLESITRQSPDTPVLVISGTGNIGDVVEALNLGAWHYILKPVDDLSVLRHTVEQALERSRLKRENRRYREYLEKEVALRTEALQDSVQKYQILTENLQEVVLSLSSSGQITYCSPVIKEFIHLSADQVVGRYFADLLADIGQRSRAADMVKRGFGMQATESMEFLLNAEGRDTPVPVELSARPVVRDGSAIALQCVLRDISERRQAEEEKKNLETQLRQAQKMESIGTLAGGIAHDFNNILSSIIGNAELVQAKLDQDHAVLRHVHSILAAGDRARELVGQILAFSRQRELDHRPSHIDTIVKESLKLLRSSLPATVEIIQDIQPTGMVMADSTQIHQLIMNLCTNAYHAMQDNGGVLTVRLKPVDVSYRQIESYGELAAGPYLKISVSDTGIGMPPAVLERIFEPYFTTKEVGKGTGLGLSVVHGIVRSHHGMIDTRSEPGKGTTFDVFLPLLAEAAPENKAAEAPLPKGTETILVVDDEKEIVAVLKQMLVVLGYDVIACTGSLEALSRIEQEPGSIDMVITDLTMPHMTGDILARETSRIRPDLPFVLCSGFGEMINEAEAAEIGIRRFILKPITMTELAKTVRDVLDAEGNGQ